MTQPLFTKWELAEHLRVSTRQIDKWCAARILPFHLLGSRKRFTYADVESFLASRSFGHRQSVQPPPSHNKETARA